MRYFYLLLVGLYLGACSDTGNNSPADPNKKDSVQNPIDSTNDSTYAGVRLTMESLPNLLQSDQIVSISGAGFDTSIRIFFGRNMIPIDTLRPNQIVFRAPWPRADYRVVIKNAKDSATFDVKVTRPDPSAVEIIDGWYAATTMVLEGNDGHYVWKLNTDSSYRLQAQAVKVDQSETIPWIKFSHDSVIGGNPYDHTFSGMFHEGKWLTFHSSKRSESQENGGPGQGMITVKRNYYFGADDLTLSKEGDIVVATSRGNLCGAYRETSSSVKGEYQSSIVAGSGSTIVIRFTPSK